MTDLMQQQV